MSVMAPEVTDPRTYNSVIAEKLGEAVNDFLSAVQADPTQFHPDCVNELGLILRRVGNKLKYENI